MQDPDACPSAPPLCRCHADEAVPARLLKALLRPFDLTWNPFELIHRIDDTKYDIDATLQTVPISEPLGEAACSLQLHHLDVVHVGEDQDACVLGRQVLDILGGEVRLLLVHIGKAIESLDIGGVEVVNHGLDASVFGVLQDRAAGLAFLVLSQS